MLRPQSAATTGWGRAAQARCPLNEDVVSMTDAERAAFWRGKRVLVTGGAGFLGANLCHAWPRRGARVTALDGFLFGGGANPANLDGRRRASWCAATSARSDLRPLCEGIDVDLQPRRADQPHGRPARPAGRHRGQRRRPGPADPGGARGGAGGGRGARLAPASSTAGRCACRWMSCHPVQPAGRQRRVQVRRRAVLDARAARAGPPRRVAAADQLLRPAPAHPRRAPDLPRHLDPPACWRADRFEVWGGEQLRDMTYVDDVDRRLPAGRRSRRHACHGRVFNIGGSPPASLLEIADLLVPRRRRAAPLTRRASFPADRSRHRHRQLPRR